MTFEIGYDVIDSRDILERIEELEAEQAELVTKLSNGEITEADMMLFDQEEGKELDMLRDFVEEAKQHCSDFEYGTTIIHENYFEEYQDKLIEDCYDLPKDLPYWMHITYDYDALKQDYVEIDLYGHTYYVWAY